MKSRLILYNSARDKDTKIEIYKKSKNKIILGPTLTQGIDLPGDLIRFIIISKVPFANLGDELVQKKMKIFPKWYESQASTEIIQGIGRGVRSKNDYCETFILDSNFNFLYLNTHTQYPKEIKERFKRFKTLSSYLTAV
jgi:Rad3-related DNA helicase